MLCFILDKLPFIKKLNNTDKAKRLLIICVSIYVLIISYTYSSFGESNNFIKQNKNYILLPILSDLSLITYNYFFSKNNKKKPIYKSQINHQIQHFNPQLNYANMMQQNKNNFIGTKESINENDVESKTKSVENENSIFSKSNEKSILDDDNEEDFSSPKENGFEENTDSELKTYDLPIYQKNNNSNGNISIGNDLPIFESNKNI